MNKAILIIVLFAFAGLATATFKADTLAPMWSAWKNQHKKTYSASEELTRFGIFVENFNKIHRLNSESDGVKYAINHFADLTATEFNQIYVSGASNTPNQKETSSRPALRRSGVLPDTVDWRNKGAVTRVRQASKCSASWAFAAVGLLEGYNFVKTGELLTFSDQQLVDCVFSGGFRCLPGWQDLALHYTATYGLEQESDYPWVDQDGKCKYDSDKAHEVNSDAIRIAQYSTDALKAALVESPVVVQIQGSEDIFQFYKSGVITTGCGDLINLPVLAVGYQKVGVLEAFIVKNSWGTNWGVDGYVYISTLQAINNGRGACGILSWPLKAI